MRLSHSAPVSGSAIAACLLFCALASGCGIFGDPDIYIANGLDEPVIITINELEYSLDPRDQSMIEVPAGEVSIRTTAVDGTLIEEIDVTVARRKDVQLYNVLGAAPAFKWWWYFTVNPNTPLSPDSREVTTFEERSWIALDNIDWVFEAPPAEVMMSETTSVTTRTSFEISPGGWRDTALVLMLDSQAGDADGRAFVERLGARGDMALVSQDLTRLLALADAGRIPAESINEAIIAFRALE